MDREKPRYVPDESEKAPGRKRSEDISWGRQVVLQLLRESPDQVQKVYLGRNVSDRFALQVGALAQKAGVVVQRVAPEVIAELCGTVNHQGVACRSSDVSMTSLEEFLPAIAEKGGQQLLVLLDHVQDPHNLGAVVRTAEACGASGVLFPKRRAALPGGTVLKVSAGAALRVPMVAVNNVSQAVKSLQEAGFWALGLDNKKGRPLWTEPMPAKSLIVVGSEGEGLSRLVGEVCDEIVRIPVAGETGSLNASVACAIGMFEWARKWGVQE